MRRTPEAAPALRGVGATRALRALAAALTLLFFAPGTAPAQTAAKRTPVVGGGSFLTAPLIGSGAYRDTLLPGERLYYGIRLQAGQRLRVMAKLDGNLDLFTADSAFSAGVQTPLREVDVLDAVGRDMAGNSTVTTDGRSTLEYETKPVLARSVAASTGIVYRGPGTWYFSLYMPTRGKLPKVEFPVNFALEVIGSPQPDPQPDKVPARPTAAATASGGSDAGGGGGTSIGTILGFGVGGLVLGGLFGAGLALATRRRPAS